MPTCPRCGAIATAGVAACTVCDARLPSGAGDEATVQVADSTSLFAGFVRESAPDAHERTAWGLAPPEDDLFAASPPPGPFAASRAAVAPEERTSMGVLPDVTALREDRTFLGLRPEAEESVAPAPSAPRPPSAADEAWMQEIHRYLRGDATADEAQRAVDSPELHRQITTGPLPAVLPAPEYRLSSDTSPPEPEPAPTAAFDGAGIVRRPRTRSGEVRVRSDLGVQHTPAPHHDTSAPQRSPLDMTPTERVAAADTVDNLTDVVRGLAMADTRPLPPVESPRQHATEPRRRGLSETPSSTTALRPGPARRAFAGRLAGGAIVASPVIAPEPEYVAARMGERANPASPPRPEPAPLSETSEDLAPSPMEGAHDDASSLDAAAAPGKHRADVAASTAYEWTPERVRLAVLGSALILLVIFALVAWGVFEIITG